MRVRPNKLTVNFPGLALRDEVFRPRPIVAAQWGALDSVLATVGTNDDEETQVPGKLGDVI